MEKELLKAGKLDTYITIYQLTRTQDSYGGYSKSRSSLKSVWAMVMPYKGKEKVGLNPNTLAIASGAFFVSIGITIKISTI